ncbi:hypothetical protein [Actinomadura livida]|uniref:Uncharacterized protein n=1 Tax=Actinomadura livida TaxID=79909 RepID=A0A7W7MVJ1_9ACTN|nr:MULTISPECIES: hypothetical protein [Actinomadura]MBB4771847.1 hypothetical protein [Actinomadura catellatispora]GGU02839.1 hypothetical protein GCM10010208_28710 [Actinomadura livida]
MTTARRLTGEANWVDLIPTMPLPAAFRFGARLGHTHGSEIVVHAVRQRSEGPFFPATVLRNIATAAATSPRQCLWWSRTLRPSTAATPP